MTYIDTSTTPQVLRCGYCRACVTMPWSKGVAYLLALHLDFTTRHAACQATASTPTPTTAGP